MEKSQRPVERRSEKVTLYLPVALVQHTNKRWRTWKLLNGDFASGPSAFVADLVARHRDLDSELKAAAEERDRALGALEATAARKKGQQLRDTALASYRQADERYQMLKKEMRDYYARDAFEIARREPVLIGEAREGGMAPDDPLKHRTITFYVAADLMRHVDVSWREWRILGGGYAGGKSSIIADLLARHREIEYLVSSYAVEHERAKDALLRLGRKRTAKLAGYRSAERTYRRALRRYERLAEHFQKRFVGASLPTATL